MKRRDVLKATSAGALLLASPSPFTKLAKAATEKPDVKAIAFDAFPVFDPRAIFGLVNATFPAHPDFGKVWFNKIFAYTWLRTSGEKYQDFHAVIAQALDYTAQAHGVDMTTAERNALLDVWFALKPWPDVAPALKQFENKGIKLSFLSNFTEEMLRANARNGGIEDTFEYLSTDLANAFKPDPQAYALAVEHFSLPKDNIAFCAFAAWDAAGASWFGYPTVWVNRLGQMAEVLDQGLVAEGSDIGVLRKFVI